MTNKLIKLSILRDNSTDPCPFGLSITHACNNAGDLIEKLVPLAVLGPEATEEENKELIEANQAVFDFQNPGQRCKYANTVTDSRDITECTWGENPDTASNNAPLGSPFYSKPYGNYSADGLTTTPQGYTADNNMSRNLFFGLQSYQSTFSQNPTKFATYIQNIHSDLLNISPQNKLLLREFALFCSNKPALIKTAQDQNIDKILDTWKEL